jgi:hypothetical protein
LKQSSLPTLNAVPTEHNVTPTNLIYKESESMATQTFGSNRTVFSKKQSTLEKVNPEQALLLVPGSGLGVNFISV